MENQSFNIISRALMEDDCDVSDDVIVEFCKVLSVQGYPSKPELKDHNSGVIVQEIPPMVWQKALEYAHKRVITSPKMNYVYPDS